LDSREIQQILPHRYPFLLVDRVLEVEDGKRAVGIKAVSGGDPFFQGHFPGYPVMPGVLIVEALAQVGGVAILGSERFRGHQPLLTGVDGFRFRRQVVPGDILKMDVTLGSLRSNFGRGHGIASVDGDLVTEGDILFAIVPPPTTDRE
jgi:3-hydroxyacyl-[acyl-carrier-protein] dehydratase